MLEPDDEICYCYHVTLRKLQNFARRRKLQKPSQMSECLGAGTGCGWCIPFLKKIFENRHDTSAEPVSDLSPEEYAQRRAQYRQSAKKKNDF